MINDRQISRLFWAAKASLIVLLLYFAAGAVIAPFWLDTAFKPHAVAGDEPRQAPVAAVDDRGDPVDYSVIVRNDLFAGDSATAHSADSGAAEAMHSAEELGLRLVGVVAFGGNPAASRAVIQSGSAKPARPYKIGDTVASATVESIEPERVILLHAGQRRALILHTATGTEAPSGPAEGLSSGSPRATGTPARSEPGPQGSMSLGYVEDVFRRATVEPPSQDGRAGGLKITGLDQTPLAAAFGLRNGDVIRVVNGQDLTNKQKAFQVLQKARAQSKLDIELVRDGTARNLSFDW